MRYFLLLLLFLPISVLSENTDEAKLSPEMTFRQISESTDLPIKKLINILELEIKDDEETPAQYGITKLQLDKTVTNYNKFRYNYYWGIVIIGMVIVFLSLALVGWIIKQLKWLGWIEKFSLKRKTVSTSLGKLISETTSPRANDIIAVITAIYLHELDTREQNKLLLTWKRASLSFWKATNKIDMPNRIFFHGNRR